MTRMSIDVDSDFHTLIKVTATYQNMNINEFVRIAIKEKIAREGEINLKTIEAIKKSRLGQELSEYKSFGSFLESEE